MENELVPNIYITQEQPELRDQIIVAVVGAATTIAIATTINAIARGLKKAADRKMKRIEAQNAIEETDN